MKISLFLYFPSTFSEKIDSFISRLVINSMKNNLFKITSQEISKTFSTEIILMVRSIPPRTVSRYVELVRVTIRHTNEESSCWVEKMEHIFHSLVKIINYQMLKYLKSTHTVKIASGVV